MTENEIINKLQLSMELAGDGGVSPFSDAEYQEMTNFIEKLKFLSIYSNIEKLYIIADIKRMIGLTNWFCIQINSGYIYKTEDNEIFYSIQYHRFDEDTLKNDEYKVPINDKLSLQCLSEYKREIEENIDVRYQVKKEEKFNLLNFSVKQWNQIMPRQVNLRPHSLICTYYENDDYQNEESRKEIKKTIPWKSKNKIDVDAVMIFFEEHWNKAFYNHGTIKIE